MSKEQSAIVRGVRVAVRNDASAFAYSALITVTFGMVNLEHPDVTTERIFLFVLGATCAFAVAEAASSRMFRIRVRDEPIDVVLVGTAMAPIAVVASLGIATLGANVFAGAVAWTIAPALATITYIVLSGAQLAIAQAYEQRHPPKESQ